MIIIAISKKLVINKDKIDLITTRYNNNFLNNINRKGRKVIDYDNLSVEELRTIKQNKINYLKSKTIKKLDNLCKLNNFKYWITIHVNSKKQYNNLMDTLKKADKELKFLSLASWSIESNLHYHIMINSILSKQDIEKRLQKLNDYDIKLIENQSRLTGYLRKNIVTDVIFILNSADEKFNDKQLQILKYKNLLSCSKNLNKTIIKKIDSNSSIEDIEELKDTIHLTDNTIVFKNRDSIIQIDKFIK